MSTFSDRLVEERKRLGLNQSDFGALGGVKKHAQLNYESGLRNPDSSYLEAIALHGVDVGYLLTGVRLPVQPSAAYPMEPAVSRKVAEPVMREVTPEQAALLDNYEHAEEEDKAAARRFLDVAAQRKGSSRRAA
ncbi:MAG: hypothetical protein GAK30_01559 [Paracidovorax wautersii]|uniref:HTH cro/C1-type domain-containing protein n=1 Tax=Paracidovorax wautersii TaxID=1177982 RepID=A0A7V8FPR1_9BURK|nr:MAG: hypothetical protein GAK30_01559 [Paracidovorax wautersii]